MGIFGRNKKSGNNALQKRLLQLKAKEINYVHTDIAELESRLREGDRALMTLTPVNYYALKNKYLRATFFTSADFSENYVVFHEVSCVRGEDKIVGKTDCYPVSKATLVNAYAKVGIMIS